MSRNFKALGLAIGALLALSAVIASSATAVPQFTCSSYPCQATGSNTKGSEVFTTEGGKVECDSHFITHSINEATSTITTTPTYTNCEAFGFLSATVNTEGCSYVSHATQTDASGTTHWWTAHVDVACPAGQSIKVTASTCKVEIKAQTGLTTDDIEKDFTDPTGVHITHTEEGIAYTVTQDGFLCPFGGTGNKTGGKYSGGVTLNRVGGGSISVSGS
jgi:hypothetical protein